MNNGYRVISQVQAGHGSDPRHLGNKGECRYCGRSDGAVPFQKKAHTFPEALGNKWVFSNDECDECNEIFSQYETSLVDAVGALLTLGGVRGKSGKVRQTGRSAGNNVIRHEGDAGSRRLSVICKDTDLVDTEPQFISPNIFRMRVPIAPTPFRPCSAYRALVKMGLALIPVEELPRFSRLRSWLLDSTSGKVEGGMMVGMAFTSVGNSPPLLCGTLLERVSDVTEEPAMLFILSAGSVCLQIVMESDSGQTRTSGANRTGETGIAWKHVVGTPEKPLLVFDYGQPIQRDWSSSETQPQPIKELVLDFNLQTTEGTLTPVFR